MSAKKKKRKINLQHVYREMLDKQVEARRNRELKNRMKELQADNYIVNDHEQPSGAKSN